MMLSHLEPKADNPISTWIRHLTCLLGVAILSGCTTSGTVTADSVIIGGSYGNPPPQLVIDPEDSSKVKWARIQAFGPVPPALLSTGQKICGRMKSADGRYMVVGYHPAALDTDGNPFPEGGFFCMPE